MNVNDTITTKQLSDLPVGSIVTRIPEQYKDGPICMVTRAGLATERGVVAEFSTIPENNWRICYIHDTNTNKTA